MAKMALENSGEEPRSLKSELEKRYYFSRPQGIAGVSLLLVALLVVATNAIVAERTWVAFNRSREQASRTERFTDQANELLSSLKDAETSERGFVLTGRDQYLEPYRQAIQDIPVFLAGLTSLAGSAGQNQRIEKLKLLVEAKLDGSQQTIDLRQNKGADAAIAAVLSGRGRIAMDQIRALNAEMVAASNGLAAQERETARIDLRTLGILTAAGSGVLFLILVLSALAIVRAARHREGLLQDLRKNEDLLSTFVRDLPAAVAMFDREMHYVQANNRWCQDFGLDYSQILGRTHYEVFPDIPERWKELHRRCLAGETLRAEEDLFERADGRRIWLRWEIRPWGSREGRPEGILIFSEDITQHKEVETAERKRIEDLLHEQEQEINQFFNNAQDAILRLDRDLRYRYVNPRVEAETGLRREAMLGKTPAELGMPEPVVAPLTRVVRSVFETGRPDVAELSYPSPGGVTHWEGRFVPEFGEKGEVKSVLAFAHDITEKRTLEQAAQTYAQQVRDLAARLLTAQEEERRRVSRDLHDDICQQLAALAIDVGGLTAGRQPPKNVQARLRAIQAGIVKAAEEARHLAHELHPSMLDDLGLVASLRELCKESERMSLAVQFSNAPLPDTMPREVASCLYRVAQESLQNIAKHSKAGHVLVALGFEEGALALTIVDNGVGFNPEAVRSRGGLGLIGMEERARLIRGKLTIESRPGHGTHIALNVPLPEANG